MEAFKQTTVCVRLPFFSSIPTATIRALLHMHNAGWLLTFIGYMWLPRFCKPILKCLSVLEQLAGRLHRSSAWFM